MKYVLFLLLALIAVSSAARAAPPQAGPTTEGFQVAVHMEKAVFDKAQCVCLALYLTNVSGHAIPVSHTDASDPAVDFKIVVKNSKSQTLPLRPDYSRILNGERQAATPAIIPLQGVLGETTKLDSMYSLKPGRYSISVMHTVPRQDGKGTVEAVSYPAYFTILK